MLVLRRDRGQAIEIGGGIRVWVLRIEGERVALGIDAPPEMIIVRQELLRRLEPSAPSAPSVPVVTAPVKENWGRHVPDIRTIRRPQETWSAREERGEPELPEQQRRNPSSLNSQESLLRFRDKRHGKGRA